MSIPFRNAEGYPDPTAYAAMSAVQQEQDEADMRAAKLIMTLKSAIDLEGFDLLARIEIRDRKTGRDYR